MLAQPLGIRPPQSHCRVKGCDKALFSSRGARPWELCEDHHTCKFMLEFEEDNREGAAEAQARARYVRVCAQCAVTKPLEVYKCRLVGLVHFSFLE